MKKHETLSFCGIYCGGCGNYKENMNCTGCRYEQELVNDCPTRTCAIYRGLVHCGECESYPCGELDSFYRDGNPTHELAYKNMIEIKEIGIEEWLLEQKRKHTCVCGQKKRWFATTCLHEEKAANA